MQSNVAANVIYCTRCDETREDLHGFAYCSCQMCPGCERELPMRADGSWHEEDCEWCHPVCEECGEDITTIEFGSFSEQELREGKLCGRCAAAQERMEAPPGWRWSLTEQYGLRAGVDFPGTLGGEG